MPTNNWIELIVKIKFLSMSWLIILGYYHSRKIFNDLGESSSGKYITLHRLICVHSSRKSELHSFYGGWPGGGGGEREKCGSRGKSVSKNLSLERFHLCGMDNQSSNLALSIWMLLILTRIISRKKIKSLKTIEKMSFTFVCKQHHVEPTCQICSRL